MTDHIPTNTLEPRREPIWVRGLIALAFLFLFSIGQTVMTAGAVLQFIWLAINGKPNESIARAGRPLARWLSAVALYVLHETEAKPFPWSDLPSS